MLRINMKIFEVDFRSHIQCGNLGLLVGMFRAFTFNKSISIYLGLNLSSCYFFPICPICYCSFPFSCLLLLRDNWLNCLAIPFCLHYWLISCICLFLFFIWLVALEFIVCIFIYICISQYNLYFIMEGIISLISFLEHR